MEKEIKDKWVKALRSGEYKQGSGQLFCNVNNSYCCLGVLCKITEVPMHEDRYFTFDDGQHYYATISTSFQKSVGLSYEQTDELIIMNDSKKYSFHEIANYIEENL